MAYSYSRRRVLDRGRILEFDAAVLASGTSRRPGVARWSELVVYLVSDGSYLISRIGRSILAHEEGCVEITWRTPRWLDATAEEQAVDRVPCPYCRPRMPQGGIDPTLFVETTRASVLLPQNEDAVLDILLDRNVRPAMILDMLEQLAQCGDPEIEVALLNRQAASRTVPS